MPETIRAPSLYLDSKKIAECSGGDFGVDAGNEVQIADGGAIGVSDGAITCKFNFNVIMPLAGMQKNVLTLLLGQSYVKMALPIAGKLVQADGKLKSGSYKWDHAKGTFTGDFSFEGLKPKQA